MDSLQDRHLDLGCGRAPRNPYRRQHLCGIDIRDLAAEGMKLDFEYRRANLFTGPIPFDDAYFSSVSAYDFLEHVPRAWVRDNGDVRHPFIEVMNEIHRVLKPGGRFFALTPFYPHAEAFQDPTHVNVITRQTHQYFCGEKPWGAMYGFKGRFNCLRVQPVTGSADRESPDVSLGQRLRHLRKSLTGGLSHLTWEFEAVK